MKRIIVLLASLLLGIGSLHAEDSETTVVLGARLIDGTGRPPIEDSAIVVANGRIVAAGAKASVSLPPGARKVDVRGKTIIPGLISAHSHLGLTKGAAGAAPENYTRENVARQLDMYEAFGITGVMSLGVNRDVLYQWRDEQRAGKLGGADIFTADRGLGVPSGAPPFPVSGDQVYRPKTAEEARAAVREMAARHPDLIKLWLDDIFGTMPKMEPAIFAAAISEAHAAIDEAHRHGLRVAAHVYYLADARALVEAGVDILAHSIRDVPVDASFVAAMKAHGVAYIPTLALDESQFIYADHPLWMHDLAFEEAAGAKLRDSWLSPEYAMKTRLSTTAIRSRSALELAKRNVKTLFDAGVPIAMGTDSGAMPTRLAGWAEHRELRLLVEAGLTPMQALVVATAGSAHLIGQEADRGTLEAGKRADFIILEANPLDQIAGTLRLESVWHGGRQIVPIVRRPPAE